MESKISKELMSKAEGFFKDAKNTKNWADKLSATKLYNILSKVQELYHALRLSETMELTDSEQQQIQYIKIRIVYEGGRDENVKAFIKAADIVEMLDKIGTSKDAYFELCHYLEALVAYKKFYIGEN